MTATRPDVGFGPVLLPFAKALLGVELGGIERGQDVGAIAPSAADFPVHARPDLEPCRRNHDRIHERALDAVKDGRLVPLVDDAHRHEHHAGPHVEGARDEEIEIRLFELELAGLFEALDHGVLDLHLADEAQAIAETDG